MLSPEQQQFFKFLLDSLHNNNFWLVLLVLVILNLPAILAFGVHVYLHFHIDSLWKGRCSDKDQEIARLAENNKALQNALLKTKR